MNLSHIEHLGIAVKSIEEALPYYEGILGLKCYNIEVVEDQKVKTAFFKVGQTKIELLEATSPESTIAKLHSMCQILRKLLKKLKLRVFVLLTRRLVLEQKT